MDSYIHSSPTTTVVQNQTQSFICRGQYFFPENFVCSDVIINCIRCSPAVMTLARGLILSVLVIAIFHISLISAQERDRCASTPSPQSAFRSAQISSNGVLNITIITITGRDMELVRFGAVCTIIFLNLAWQFPVVTVYNLPIPITFQVAFTSSRGVSYTMTARAAGAAAELNLGWTVRSVLQTHL